MDPPILFTQPKDEGKDPSQFIVPKTSPTRTVDLYLVELWIVGNCPQETILDHYIAVLWTKSLVQRHASPIIQGCTNVGQQCNYILTRCGAEIQETIPTIMPKEESAECLVLPPATHATS